MARLICLLVLLVLVVGLDARSRRAQKRKPLHSTPTTDKLFRLKLEQFKTTLEIGNPPKKMKFEIDQNYATTYLYTYVCLKPKNSMQKVDINQPQCNPKAIGYSPTTSTTAQYHFDEPGPQSNRFRDCMDQLRFLDSTEPTKMLKNFSLDATPSDEPGLWKGTYTFARIGLGATTLTSPTSFVSQAMEAKLFARPQYSILHEPCKPFDSCPGAEEVIFGGLDSKKCVPSGKPITVLDRTDDRWYFQPDSYQFIYTESGKESKTLEYNQDELQSSGTKVQFSSSSQYVVLPTSVYEQLKNSPGFAVTDTGSLTMPCDAKLELRFKIKDDEGNVSEEWSLNEEDLRWHQMSVDPQTKKPQCLLAMYKRDQSGYDNDLEIGAPLFAKACITYDLDKQTVSLNRRLQ